MGSNKNCFGKFIRSNILFQELRVSGLYTGLEVEPSNDDLKNLYDALWKSEGGRRPPTSGAKPYTNLENLFDAYDYVDGGPRQGELSFTLRELQPSKVML